MEQYSTLKNCAWDEAFSPDQQTQLINQLEMGGFIFFPNLPFKLNYNEYRFLSANYVDPKTKNISYDPRNNLLKGAQANSLEYEEIKSMLNRFSHNAVTLITNLFPAYAPHLEQAKASFRPVEITNRRTSYRKDDKRLHVDAFPSNPNQGRRILRVFSNINQHGMDRVWRIGEPFKDVAQQFLPKIPSPIAGSAKILKLLKITKSTRTEYDHIMLQIHDRMKADMIYQQTAKQIVFRFPPGSTWVVQTDHVSHAAMSGQHLLEQTFYLPVSAMQNAAHSPLKILEELTGRNLV